MIYHTGDRHGSIYELTRFCHKMNLSYDESIDQFSGRENNEQLTILSSGIR